eukprot:gene5580-1328_t
MSDKAKAARCHTLFATHEVQSEKNKLVADWSLMVWYNFKGARQTVVDYPILLDGM